METMSSSSVLVYRYSYGLLTGIFSILLSVFLMGAVAVLVLLSLWLVIGFFIALFGGQVSHLGVPIYAGMLPIVVIIVPPCIIGVRAMVCAFAHNWAGALSYATILLDNNGISSRIAGRRSRQISWRDVERITKRRVRDSGENSLGYEDNFTVESRIQKGPKWLLVNLRGSITFEESIKDYKRLVQEINAQAKRHKIPLFFFNKEATKDMTVPNTKYELVEAF